MKLASWNVNGIRAAQRKGLEKWMAALGADAICLQETKAGPNDVDEGLREPKGYKAYWHPAKKPGYSGTVIYSRKEPVNVVLGLGVPEIDDEGRVITVEYKEVTLITGYFPNSQPEGKRLDYKLLFLGKMKAHLQALTKKGKPATVCGDFNIAHKEIDLANPKTNTKNPGFLPEERAWMDEMVKLGYIDSFRKFNQQPGQYTWWSQRPGVREKNVGWRLDLFLSNPPLDDRLKGMEHQTKVLGSDHCPVVLELKK